MESNNTTSTAENNTTGDTASPRVCAAHECSFEVPPPRTDTRPEVADLCTEHRTLARRMQHNRGVELATAAQQLRERGYTPLAPKPPTKAPGTPPARPPSVTSREGTCPVPGCREPSARSRQRGAPELRDLCADHRKRARDLAAKIPGYTPALARERVVTGQRPAALGAAPTASESGARGGKARTKTLRPAVAETVRRVPAAPTAKPCPPRATQPSAGYTSAVDTIRRLVAVRDQIGGVEAVEEAARIIVSLGGVAAARELIAALGGAS
jgi:hypothetical protein